MNLAPHVCYSRGYHATQIPARKGERRKWLPQESYKNYINGEWVPSTGQHTFDNLNPADQSDLVGIFQKSNRQDVNDAIGAALDAARAWRLTPPPKRGEILLPRRPPFGGAQRRAMPSR